MTRRTIIKRLSQCLFALISLVLPRGLTVAAIEERERNGQLNPERALEKIKDSRIDQAEYEQALEKLRSTPIDQAEYEQALEKLRSTPIDQAEYEQAVKEFGNTIP